MGILRFPGMFLFSSLAALQLSACPNRNLSDLVGILNQGEKTGKHLSRPCRRGVAYAFFKAYILTTVLLARVDIPRPEDLHFVVFLE